MKGARTLAGLLLVAVLLGGCWPRYMSPEMRATRWHVGYGSLLAPQEGRWSLVHQGRDAVMFGAERRSETHSLLASARVTESARVFTDQAELVAFMRAERPRDTGPRFHEREYVEAADDRFGPYCSRYRIVSEDAGAVNKGGAAYLLLRTEGMTCFHPAQRARLIHLGYSERALESEADPHLAAKADRFFATFRFEEPR